jgi:hypothetical protein
MKNPIYAYEFSMPPLNLLASWQQFKFYKDLKINVFPKPHTLLLKY